MKWNRYGQEVADDDPTGIYDARPENPEALPAPAAPTGADPAVLAAYQQQLIAESTQRAELQRQLDTERARNATAPAAVSPEAEREFFNTPITSTRDMIRTEVAAAVAPINNFTQQFTRAQEFSKLKQQMHGSGKFPYLTKLEAIFDQAMNGVEPTVQNMTVAYQQVLGFFISNGGKLEESTPVDNTPAPTSTPAAPPVKPLPPHARPAAPAAPSRNAGKTQVRALNENEKIIKRHNGYSHDAQYLFWTEHVTPSEIGHITPEIEKARIKEIFGVDI